MWKEHATTFMIGFLGVGVAALAVVDAVRFSYTVYEPLKVIDTHVENPEVKFGDILMVHHVYVRTAYCKADIDRFIIKLPEELLVRRERLPAGTTLIGQFDRTIMIPTKFPSQVTIPFGIADIATQDLFPGFDYLLREFIHSDCGDRIHTVIVPDAKFRVVE